MSSRYARFIPSVAQNSGSYFLAPRPGSVRAWIRRHPVSAGGLQLPAADGAADKPARNIVAGNWRRLISRLASRHHYEGDHCGNCFLTMDILASNF